MTAELLLNILFCYFVERTKLIELGYNYLNYLMCLVKWSFHNIKAKTKQKGTYHATDNKHFTCALEKHGVLIRTLFNKQFALPCR